MRIENVVKPTFETNKLLQTKLNTSKTKCIKRHYSFLANYHA